MIAITVLGRLLIFAAMAGCIVYSLVLWNRSSDPTASREVQAGTEVAD